MQTIVNENQEEPKKEAQVAYEMLTALRDKLNEVLEEYEGKVDTIN